jgi:hypothetical protein
MISPDLKTFGQCINDDHSINIHISFGFGRIQKDSNQHSWYSTLKSITYQPFMLPSFKNFWKAQTTIGGGV